MKNSIYANAKTYALKIIAKEPGYSIPNAKKIFGKYYWIVEAYLKDMQVIYDYRRIRTSDYALQARLFDAVKKAMKNIVELDEIADAKINKLNEQLDEAVKRYTAGYDKYKNLESEAKSLYNAFNDRITAIMQADALNGLTNSTDPADNWAYQDKEVQSLGKQFIEIGTKLKEFDKAGHNEQLNVIRSIQDSIDAEFSSIDKRFAEYQQSVFKYAKHAGWTATDIDKATSIDAGVVKAKKKLALSRAKLDESLKLLLLK